MERWQTIEMLLAERYGIGLAYPTNEPSGSCRIEPWVPDNDCRRAIRLAGLHLDGPAALTTCDHHFQPNRPDLWEQCRKVAVVDALLGRRTDCGA